MRAWMHEAAVQADLDPDRLSFTHALQVLETAGFEWAITHPSDWPTLTARLWADLSEPQYRLPPRRLRFYPRVVKHPFSHFRRKHSWHPSYHFKGGQFVDLLLI